MTEGAGSVAARGMRRTEARGDRRQITALGLAWTAVVATLAGGLLWLALGAEDTVETLRTGADDGGPVASGVLPEVAQAPPPPDPVRAPLPDPDARADAEPDPAAVPEPSPEPADDAVAPDTAGAPPADGAADTASAEPGADAEAVAEAPEPSAEPPPEPAPPPDVVVDAAPDPDPDATAGAPAEAPAEPALEVPPPGPATVPAPETVAEAPPPAAGDDASPPPADIAAVPDTPPPAEAAPADPAPRPEPEASAVPAPALDQLTEPGPAGPLPRIAPDGTPPWQAFAAPHADGSRPQVALVVVDLGLMRMATERALALPAPVTLAFSPYGPATADAIGRARDRGHEVLLQVPTEPEAYPVEDPGPQTLRVSLGPDENLARLHWVMGQGVGYVGLADLTGSRFAASADALRPVMDEMGRRGLLWLDGRPGDDATAERLAAEAGVPHLTVDAVVGDIASADAIDARLAELATLARQQGRAVGLVVPYPVAFDRVGAWAAGLADQGLSLAPVSALASTGG